MRIAVVGGTGVAGRHAVHALRQAGHDVVVIARSHGADVLTGRGLDEALAGVDVVVDASSVQAPDAEATRAFFATATQNLLAAELRARVKHHVLLSILGVDRIDGNMVRRIAIARHESIALIPSWRTGIFGVDAAGEILLPDAGARLAPTTFDAWLAALAARADRAGDR